MGAAFSVKLWSCRYRGAKQKRAGPRRGPTLNGDHPGNDRYEMEFDPLYTRRAGEGKEKPWAGAAILDIPAQLALGTGQLFFSGAASPPTGWPVMSR
jgi:hypothetical protein